MTATVNSNRDFDVQQLNDVIPGVFAQKTAFMGSILASQGAVIVNGTLPSGPGQIGNTITVPRFGVIGEFEDLSENVAATPAVVSTRSETATVGRSALSFEVSVWSQHPGVAALDPYTEAATQLVESAQRKMDSLIITEALTTPLVASYYSATFPAYLDWDKVVDARAKWGDRQNDIVGMVVHSRTEAGLRKMRDNQGRPLLLDSMKDGTITTFCGVPIIVSDHVPLTGSTMTSPMTESGALPDITLSGTPTGPWNLKIVCVTTGTQTTAVMKFSTDGGNTYSANYTNAASVVLTDTAKDSTVGNNGTTGITATMAVGTYTAGDSYTSTANLKTTSLIVQKGALVFWYNRALMQVQTYKDILKDNDLAAVHMYRAAHLYGRRVGGNLPGVVAIDHNVQGYVG